MLAHVRKNVGDVIDDLTMPANATRAECVKVVIEKRTFELYEKLDPRAYQLACNTRGGKGYGEAGITLINALWNNTNEIFSPDVSSMGCIQEFDPHVSVRRPRWSTHPASIRSAFRNFRDT